MPIKRKTNKVTNDKLNDMRPEPGPTHVDVVTEKVQHTKGKLKSGMKKMGKKK